MEDFSNFPILAKINSPDDVKALPEKELPDLAREIREYLVYRVGENGGHLASNLGAVELTMGIHRVFSSPRDHIIFDVGHQSYVHKLLTGRKEAFDTLRQPGGISGFPRREESAADAFGAGHSSTAISAAVGMAEAERLRGSDAYTVAVVGDGALTGGLSYEGLNNCRRNLRLIIILNENEMSISRNQGRLAGHISHLRSSRKYLKTKEFTSSALRHVPLLGKPIYHTIRWFKRRIKHLFYGENFFEHMGVRYLGPVDGNDLGSVIACLEHAKRLSCSVILHVKTKKGKGYAPAEEAPGKYHGLAPRGAATPEKTFSAVFGETLTALAAGDPRVIGITAAMSDGTGLTPFAKTFPSRFFDVGIAEGHAVTFAAGLAAAGERPVVAVYSTFLQRAYDNILHDVALQRLPVLFCIDRAGLNLHDGVTHHGIFDVAMLSALPDFRIFAPVTFAGLRRSMELALSGGAPAAVRYPCGGEKPEILSAFYETPAGDPGVRMWQNGEKPDVTVVTYGRIVTEALAAAKTLAEKGVAVRILLCEIVSPAAAVAKDLQPEIAGRAVLFLEEGVLHGGFAENVSVELAARGASKPFRILAIENGFRPLTKGQTPAGAAGIDAAAIAGAVNELIKEKKNDSD